MSGTSAIGGIIMDGTLRRMPQQEKLISLLYVSSATSFFTDEQLITFLRSWRNYNQAHQITGFLLYQQGNFMQVLEGPESSIQTLIEAIKVDTRHHRMIILWQKPIVEREFGEWCMGFRKASELAPDDEQTFSYLLQDPTQEKKFRNHPGSSHKMLAQFKRICLPEYNA
jgi:hypothetical protein